MLKCVNMADYIESGFDKDIAVYVPDEQIIEKDLRDALTGKVQISKKTTFFLYHWTVEGDAFGKYQEIWKSLMQPGYKCMTDILYRGSDGIQDESCRSYSSSKEIALEFLAKKHDDFMSDVVCVTYVDTNHKDFMCYPLYEVIDNMTSDWPHLWNQVLEHVKREKEYIVLENDCISIMD